MPNLFKIPRPMSATPDANYALNCEHGPRIMVKNDLTVLYDNLHVLPNAADAYRVLTQSAYTSAEDRDVNDPNVNLLLHFLNSIPAAYSQWKLGAVRLLYDGKRRGHISVALYHQLAALERMTVCFWFIGEAKHRRGTRSNVKELEKSGEHWQHELQLTEDECARFKATIDSPELYKKGTIPKAKYRLLRVDALLRETPSSAMNMQTQANKKVTIEHILPQAPTDVWRAAFPNEDERQAMPNQLENLTLTSRAKNSASGQLPYCEKLEKYLTNPGLGSITSDFALNNDLVRQHRCVWDPSECRDRHNRLMQLLLCGDPCWRLSTQSGGIFHLVYYGCSDLRMAMWEGEIGDMLHYPVRPLIVMDTDITVDLIEEDMDVAEEEDAYDTTDYPDILMVTDDGISESSEDEHELAEMLELVGDDDDELTDDEDGDAEMPSVLDP
eukprot:gene9389-11125_t